MQLITDGDVSGALNAVAPDRAADFLWGIGGTPEGVITAAAVKCIGGALVGRLGPRDDAERRPRVDAGYDLDRVLTHDDLVRGDDVFFSATGVTDGDVLQGVRYEGARGASTESLVMRSRSGTVRRIQSRHDRDEAARAHRIRRRRDAARARAAAPAASAPTTGHGVSPTLTGSPVRAAPSPFRPAVAKRPTADSSSSSLASERRKPCVTSTWMRDCVFA